MELFTSMNSDNKQKISLISAIALSITASIGSGWLFSAQLIAKAAGNYSFLAWIFAGVLVILVSICLSRIVSIYPVRGATTRSSSLSHNNVFGMSFAFANWFGIMVTIGAEASATTQYLASAIKSVSLMNANGLTLWGKLLAELILLIYLIINFFGIKIFAKVNNIITIIKIFTPIFVIVIFLVGHFDSRNFSLVTNNIYSYSSIFPAILGTGLIYSFNGFQIPTAFASEIKNPGRNVLLSMIISITVVTGIYLLLELAFMGAVPHSMLNHGWASINFHSPLLNLALVLGLGFLSNLIIIDSIISPSGVGYTYLGGASRMFFAMAKAGQMPQWSISKLHPVYKICRRSLIINFLLTIIVLWNSNNWSSLMIIVTIYHVIGYMAAPISMGALEPKTRPLGIIVFVVLGILMSTLPQHYLFMTNLSLLIIILIYVTTQIYQAYLNFRNALAFAAPVTIYLWLIYAWHNIYYIVILSALFYILITSKSYIKLCKAHDSPNIEFNSSELND